MVKRSILGRILHGNAPVGVSTVPTKMWVAIAGQAVYIVGTTAMILYEHSNERLINSSPAQAIVKLISFMISTMLWYRNVDMYLRLMFMWSLIMILGGVVRPFKTFENETDEVRTRFLLAYMLSNIFGIIGNVFGGVILYQAKSARKEHSS